MKFLLKLSLGFATLFILPAGLRAQNTLNVTGHSARINGMSFDYSIGEMTLVSTEKANTLS